MDSLQEDRLITAVEKIATSFGRIATSLEEKNDFNADWGERLEYYLHLVKQKFQLENEETGDNSSIQE